MQDDAVVELSELARMAGLPQSVAQSELQVSGESIPLTDLRAAMLQYLGRALGEHKLPTDI